MGNFTQRTISFGICLIALALGATGCAKKGPSASGGALSAANNNVDSNNKNKDTTILGTPSPTPIADLSLTSGNATAAIGQSLPLKAAGGVPPYVYSVLSGGGTVSPAGVYQAPYALGTAVIQVADSRGIKKSITLMLRAGEKAVPSDAYFGLQYGLSNAANADVNAPEAWGIRTDCSNIPVAVIDTGIDLLHMDLKANIWINQKEKDGTAGADDDGDGYVDDLNGWNFVAKNKNPQDDNYHGTHVAGIIGAAGNNAIGVSGICWKASLIAVKALDATGSGALSDLTDGINYAKKVGAKVINASWGGGGFNQTMKDAIDAAGAAGVLFVNAAGNGDAQGVGQNNNSVATYPSNYVINATKPSTSMLVVASTDPGASNSLSSFSNYGATAVQIAAPGQNILSTFPCGVDTNDESKCVSTAAAKAAARPYAYHSISGTSMATPMVAGAAALLWSLDPTMTLAAIRDRILAKSDTSALLNGKILNSKQLNIQSILTP